MLNRRWLLAWVPLLGLGLAVAGIWWLADLDAWRSPEQVAQRVRALGEHRFAGWYVLGIFAAGSLLFVPITALVLGTILAFGPGLGSVYGYLGVVLASALTYWSGRLLGARALLRLQGPRLVRFGELLRAGAFRASVLARLLPLGNFTAINMFVGSLRAPFLAFLAGSSVGALPGLLVFALFSERMLAAMKSPDLSHVAQALALVALIGGGVLWLRRARRRRKQG